MRELVLDLDSLVSEAHGIQEGTAYRELALQQHEN
jgi:hypothetical protein